MRTKPLITLLVLALVLVWTAHRLTRQRTPPPPPELGRLLLPGLPLNEVARVTVSSATSTVTVERTEGVWTVRERHGYPAQFTRLRDALIRLSDLKIADVRPADQASARERMGFSPTASGDLSGGPALLTLENQSGQTLGALRLGGHHLRRAPAGSPYMGEFPEGRYITPFTGTVAYLVKDPLHEFTDQPNDWIDTQLLNVDAESLIRIQIDGAEREPLTFERPADGGPFTLAGLGPDEEPDPGALSGVTHGLAYLHFEDLTPLAPEDDLDAFTVTRYTAESREGHVYHLHFGTPDAQGAFPVRLAFVRQATDASDTESESGEAAALADFPAGLTHLTQWVFRLPTYKAQAMTISRERAVRAKTEALTADDLDAPGANAEAAEWNEEDHEHSGH